MFSAYEKQLFIESTLQSSRWYFNNQNTDKNPWGGMKNSADNGRFVYEYFPATKLGRGAGVWAQALGIMALGSVNWGGGKGYEYWQREEAIKLAAGYMSNLQFKGNVNVALNGGFSEHTPNELESYPRDAATGGIGMCVLYRLTGDKKYLEYAENFAKWYKQYGSDKNGWPYISFDFAKGRGTNKSINVEGEEGDQEFIKGDWQAGGGLAYYYLASISGNKTYLTDYLYPLMDQLVAMFDANPYEGAVPGFHGEVPISFGNDDFALVTLLGAYKASGNKKYYETAKSRIYDFLKYWDEPSGRFPSLAGTFVSGITLKVFVDLEVSQGRKPEQKILDAIKKIALGGLSVQAFDYNEQRVHGGFWGQSEYEAGRDRIHHRTTGYATVFYSMLSYPKMTPFYHILDWEMPK
jgi:hypothetical protein